VKVLVLSPHPDDETLGCGATMTRLADERHEVVVGLITGFGEGADHPLYPREGFDLVQAELQAACDVMGVSRIVKANLPTVLLPDLPRHVLNKAVLDLVEGVGPDALFVPFPLDLHGDHREIFHAASVAWRPYLPLGRTIRDVYCYEVPSETHLNIPYVEQGFIPNTFFDVSAQVDRKIKAFECFRTQVQQAPMPRSPEALRALAVYRGSQIGVAAAEAFVSVRSLR
jgi:LmbE family N-acetylglucosaminyl deacetylase